MLIRDGGIKQTEYEASVEHELKVIISHTVGLLENLPDKTIRICPMLSQ